MSKIFDDSLLQDSVIPKIIAYYDRTFINYSMIAHRHKYVEIMYVVSGSCIMHFQNQNITLKEKQMIIIGNNVIHQLEVPINSHGSLLNVEIDFIKSSNILTVDFAKLYESYPPFKRSFDEWEDYIIISDENNLLYPILKNAIRNEIANELGTDEIASMLISQLIVMSSFYEYKKKNSKIKYQIDYVSKAITFLENNFSEDISVSDVAKYVGVHQGYLHRIFKTNTGNTINDFIVKLRIEKAKKLLEHTTFNIMNVATEVGINNQQYFVSFFKKATGMSPSEYRKSIEKQVAQNNVINVDIQNN